MVKSVSSYSKRKKSQDESQDKEKLSVVLTFFAWGCIIFLFESLTFSAAEDILAGTNLQTTTILVAFEVANVFVFVTGPQLVISIPLLLSVSLAVLSLVGGLLVVVLVVHVSWKIFGVVLIGFGYGYGCVIVLSLSSFFQTKKMVSAFAAGTSVGFMVSLLYYTAMTTWFFVSPNITLALMSPIALLYFACYYVINKNRIPKAKTCSSSDTVAYMSLPNSDDINDTKEENSNTLTLKEKMSVLKTLLVTVTGPMFITLFGKFTILQAVITTLAYQSSPFRPRDHYQYYYIAFWVGEVIGRTHRIVLSFVNSNWLYSITLKGLWALAFIEAFHLLFLIFESWYRFLPGVGIVLCLCCTAGLTVGLEYTSSLELFSECLEEKQRKFGMGFAIFPMTVGVLTAAFMGLRLEPQLKEHCMNTLTNVAYCITRSSSIDDITLRRGRKM